jgi:hypothetical protein
MFEADQQTIADILNGLKIVEYSFNGQTLLEGDFNALEIREILEIRNGGNSTISCITVSIVDAPRGGGGRF